MNNRYKHLIKNSTLLLMGSFASKIPSFLMVPFYTNVLSTKDYGIADLISTTVILLLPLFSVLMDESLLRYTLDKKNDVRQVVSISFYVSTIGFVIFLFLSPVIFLIEPLKPFYGYIIFYYIMSWIYNLISSYVKGKDLLGLISVGGIIHTFLFAGLNIVFLVYLKLGIYGYLLAINISNLFTAIFLFVKSKMWTTCIQIKKINKKLVKEMVGYSAPMIPNYISWWVNTSSDKYMVSLFCGISITGIYSVAGKIPTALSMITSIFSSAWRISSVEDFGSKESIQFFNKIYKFYSGILLLGASVLVFVSKILAKYLYSKEFYSAWRITPFLILSFVICALANFVESIFNASKQTKKIFHASLCGAAFNILLNIVLIPFFAGIGAAIATTISYSLIWIFDMINTKKILDMDYNLVNNILSIFFIVLEIVNILVFETLSYYINILCLIAVILLNREIMFQCFNIVIDKFKHK